MTGFGRPYTQAERQTIEVWLREGDSASQIAAKFPSAFGRSVSRNAIIGVVHRDPVLREIGFDRGNKARAGKRKPKTLPGAPKMQLPLAQPIERGKNPAPYKLPGKLFLAAIEGDMRETDAYALLAPATRTPSPTVQPHFAAMRFLDCLFDRCRAPISSDLEEKPGPDMLCCGHKATEGKPYCSYHVARLCDRVHDYRAVAA